ncbi:hypothetical protein OG205_35770 [Lentzea sp. NBC_00516]|uniref:hypothetical protein n=1 Tax=Lentzea sp. NBC_00516 TaxID=2903582 RepID=UPI002E8108CD|nr:hypothetical protein [Lentzea sp. NBC_00516]WUD23375.1 hypothetical protein OG205_35770 [Lentzea sp. NBC_00516]
MTKVVDVTREQLLERREAILKRHDTNLETLSEKAANFELAGEEWEAWDSLQEIAFLLGDK